MQDSRLSGFNSVLICPHSHKRSHIAAANTAAGALLCFLSGIIISMVNLLQCVTGSWV